MNRLGRLSDHLQTAEHVVARALGSQTSSVVVAGETMKTRYAVVGLGGRSVMYSSAILSTYADRAELVGICDINQDRMDYYLREWQKQHGKGGDIPTYDPSQFEQMLSENQVDTVIVTTMDRTHHRYIIRAMRAGCNAITEKPMTVDEKKCQQILDTIEETGKSLRVTFNYRYAPRASKVKELIMAGTIGEVKSVHFEWLLDTIHGADYFRRWHRNKNNSGGLMVHKATHHFDLVNWWIDSKPETVMAMGDLDFYGRENAEERGVTKFYDRGTDHPNAKGDPFAVDLNASDQQRELYLSPADSDGYRRDQSVFGDGIDIEDDMAVLVRYANGAKMSYHLTAYSPWEGFRVAFNGTKGRIELECVERGQTEIPENADGPTSDEEFDAGSIYDTPSESTLTVQLHWQKAVRVEIPGDRDPGHGGGDQRLLDDIFIGGLEDPLQRAANHVQGAQSILTGIAANIAFATGAAVKAQELVQFAAEPVSTKSSATERLEEAVEVTDEVDADAK